MYFDFLKIFSWLYSYMFVSKQSLLILANLYLDVNREMKDLYYEEHHDTAIMFASIVTNDLQDTLNETLFLSTMNEYIIAFDTVRTQNKNSFRLYTKLLFVAYQPRRI